MSLPHECFVRCAVPWSHGLGCLKGPEARLVCTELFCLPPLPLPAPCDNVIARHPGAQRLWPGVFVLHVCTCVCTRVLVMSVLGVAWLVKAPTAELTAPASGGFIAIVNIHSCGGVAGVC